MKHKPNIKILTKDELKTFNDYYKISYQNNMILVEPKDFSRITVHKSNETFYLLRNKRRITITTNAINLWKKEFKDKYTLIEVQNAMNALFISYQNTLDKENVENQILKFNNM